ncbi:MAG: AAA family ATPase, partial [Candidatus Heimdallarchaeota archaeon]
GIDSVQVIGEFNYKKQLLQMQKNQFQNNDDSDIFSEEFFIPRPLFKAFLSKKECVLLIDELDSADEEFFAFLLEALGENQITIPEMGTIKANNQPLVFMTSNSKQDLPEALRRRALYLYIDFPVQKREENIVKFHCPDTEENLIRSLIYIVQEIRKLDLRKHPSISESIDWANTLLHLTINKIDVEAITKTLNVLVKHNEDMSIVKSEIEKIIGSENPYLTE